jgi:acyl carrier protein
LVIIDFLAELQDKDPSELRAELSVGGSELPVDSLLIVEILTRLEEHFGVSIPADAEAARSTRSVRAFSRTVLDSIIEGQQP